MPDDPAPARPPPGSSEALQARLAAEEARITGHLARIDQELAAGRERQDAMQAFLDDVARQIRLIQIALAARP